MGAYAARREFSNRLQMVYGLFPRLQERRNQPANCSGLAPAFFNLGEIQIWPVLGVTIIALLLFWAGALVFAYVADDLSPAPADERSVRAPKPY